SRLFISNSVESCPRLQPSYRMLRPSSSRAFAPSPMAFGMVFLIPIAAARFELFRLRLVVSQLLQTSFSVCCEEFLMHSQVDDDAPPQSIGRDRESSCDN